MSSYVNKLRLEKKAELSQRVFSSLVEDIWERSWAVQDSEAFVDYLMTITNQEAIEEFFNRCHDANGRFCGGGGSGRRISGNAKNEMRRTRMGLDPAGWPRVRYDKLRDEKDIQDYVKGRRR